MNKISAAENYILRLEGIKNRNFTNAELKCLKEGMLGELVNATQLNIFELEDYISTRQKERDDTGKQRHRAADLFKPKDNNRAADTKIQAAGKWIKHLKREEVIFEEDEINSLKNGRLEKMVNKEELKVLENAQKPFEI